MIKPVQPPPGKGPQDSPEFLWNVLPFFEQIRPAAKFYEARSFLISKLTEHDVVFLGANHSRNNSLEIVRDILPRIAKLGVRFIGLEIATDQQPALDAFMREGKGLHDIDISAIIACPEYRSLIDSIRKADLCPVALDLPRSLWPSPWRRDEWMAERVADVLRLHPGGKMLVVVGNLHALKTVRWADPQNHNMFIPGYLCRTEPKLRLCSILTEHTPPGNDGKGTPALQEGRIPLAVNLSGLDLELRIQNLLAVRKMDPEEMADGLILF